VQAIFDTLGAYYHSIAAQLNPYSPANQVVYYTWLVLYTFTGVAVWRSRRAWFRFVCFLISQAVSLGMIQATWITLAIAVAYWRESLAIFVVTAAVSLFLFRRRI
jgi:hypothetical protein